MTTDLVLPIHDPAIIDARDRAAAIYAEAEALVIDSVESQGHAVTLLSGIARVKGDAELARVRLTKPFNDHVKGVNNIFRDVLAPVEKADGLLRGRDLTFRTNQKRLAAEAAAAAERQRFETEARMREAERAEAAGHPEVAEKLLEGAVASEEGAKVAQAQAVLPAKTVTTPTGSATTIKRWTFKVLDLANVPRLYLMLNEPAIREAIRELVRRTPSLDIRDAIFGLEIYQDESLSVKK